MEFKDHITSHEHPRVLHNPSSMFPLQVSKIVDNAHGFSPKLSSSHNIEGNCVRDGTSNEGGLNGNGKRGDVSYAYNMHVFNHDHNSNNNNNEKIEDFTPRTRSIAMEEYRKKAIIIIEEYFANDDFVSTTNELRDLGMPNYDYYFVKKLISMAMDRHDKEKEMAAVLLSSLYGNVINPGQVYKGFSKLVESVDDLVVDIPNVVDVVAVFIARAVVDDILPPIFLSKQITILPKGSKGVEVVRRTEKRYLSVPYHAEIVEKKWGGSKNKTVDDMKAKISTLLTEYVVSGDKQEACRCIKELNVPFFHHEVMKRALIIAMERRKDEGRMLGLLRMAAEEGLINASQITKGFNRTIDTIDDLSLDIPKAKQILQSLLSKCASEGWLSASSLKSLPMDEHKRRSLLLEDGGAKSFNMKVQTIIQEYFLSRDTTEVYCCLKSENNGNSNDNGNVTSTSSDLNAIFVKRLINLAMDRKNKEKELASVLLSSLCLPANDIANGFIMLMELADDIALDNPVIIEDLVKFLARAVTDEVISPSHLEDIGNHFQFIECDDSKAKKIIQMTKSLLKARLSGERILRCWGGGGEGSTGDGWWTIDDVKDKIGKILEEYECGGDVREAFRCIKELGMPFFHHEVVKKALVIVMEKKNNKLWNFLQECFTWGLITENQMTKGFVRLEDSLDDLSLDVPDAKKQFSCFVDRAKILSWLDPSSFF